MRVDIDKSAFYTKRRHQMKNMTEKVDFAVLS